MTEQASPAPAADLEAAAGPFSRIDDDLIARLRENASGLTTRALSSMDEDLPWFSALSAEQRSWITLVARSGIDGFISWIVARRSGEEFDAASVFRAAPRELAGAVSLHHTVELVRTSIAEVERGLIDIVPPEALTDTHLAVLTFAREVAFASADVYARAAEARGAWDARLESLVVDAIVRADEPDTIMSRASALEWHASDRVAVVAGQAAPPPGVLPSLRRRARRMGLDCVVADQADRTILVLGCADLAAGGTVLDLGTQFADYFGEGHIVVGPIVTSLAQAHISARAALSGLRASTAWPEGPRVVSSDDLLPERVLAGDGHARHTLVHDVYQVLRDAHGDLLLTCVAFLDHGLSVEATARALYVHPNTVRYRLRRVQEVCGYSPAHTRDAYVLRLAITLGRQATL